MTLKELIKKQDLNAAQIGRRLGVSRSTVCYWIKGKSVPSLMRIAELSKILCCSNTSLIECFYYNKQNK